MLQDGEQGDAETEAQQKPDEVAPLGPCSIRLYAEEEQGQQRREFQQFNSRQEWNRRLPRQQLESRHQPKTKQWPEKRVPYGFCVRDSDGLQRPDQQQNRGANFEDCFRPGLDGAVRKHSERDQYADARAYKAHLSFCTKIAIPLLAADRHESHIVNPQRAAQFVVQALARFPRDPDDNQARLRPGGEICLLHGPRESPRFVLSQDVQILWAFGIENFKAHSALCGNLIATQKSLKTITSAGSNQDPLK